MPNASLRNMALVGRARARLDIGNLAGAAADAAGVPAGFVRGGPAPDRVVRGGAAHPRRGIDGRAPLDAINRVRALSNIPALVPPAGADMMAIILEERRRQLCSERHRYVDMLLKNLPFTTGINRKGQIISNLTCVPLPLVETQNNPNFNS